MAEDEAFMRMFAKNEGQPSFETRGQPSFETRGEDYDLKIALLTSEVEGLRGQLSTMTSLAKQAFKNQQNALAQLKEAKTIHIDISPELDQCVEKNTELTNQLSAMKSQHATLVDDLNSSAANTVELRIQLRRLLELLKKTKRDSQAQLAALKEQRKVISTMKERAVNPVVPTDLEKLAQADLNLAQSQLQLEEVVEQTREARSVLKEETETSASTSPKKRTFADLMKNTKKAEKLVKLFLLDMELEGEVGLEPEKFKPFLGDGVVLDTDMETIAMELFAQFSQEDFDASGFFNSFKTLAGRYSNKKKEIDAAISKIDIQFEYSPAASSSSSSSSSTPPPIDKTAAFEAYLLSGEYLRQGEEYIWNTLISEAIFGVAPTVERFYQLLAKVVSFFARFKIKATKKETKINYFDGVSRDFSVTEKFKVGGSSSGGGTPESRKKAAATKSDNQAVQDIIRALIELSVSKESRVVEETRKDGTKHRKTVKIFSPSNRLIDHLNKIKNYDRLDMVLSKAYDDYVRLSEMLCHLLSPFLQFDEEKGVYAGSVDGHRLEFHHFEIEEEGKEPVEVLQETKFGDSEVIYGHVYDWYDQGLYMPFFLLDEEIVKPHLYDYAMFIYHPLEKKVELLKRFNEIQILGMTDAKLKKNIARVREQLLEEQEEAIAKKAASSLKTDEEYYGDEEAIDVNDIFENEGKPLMNPEHYVEFVEASKNAQNLKELYEARILALLREFSNPIKRSNVRATLLPEKIENGGYGFTNVGTIERYQRIMNTLEDYGNLLLHPASNIFLFTYINDHLPNAKGDIPFKELFVLSKDETLVNNSIFKAVLAVKGERFVKTFITLDKDNRTAFRILYRDAANTELKNFIDKDPVYFAKILKESKPEDKTRGAEDAPGKIEDEEGEGEFLSDSDDDYVEERKDTSKTMGDDDDDDDDDEKKEEEAILELESGDEIEEESEAEESETEESETEESETEGSEANEGSEADEGNSDDFEFVDDDPFSLPPPELSPLPTAEKPTERQKKRIAPKTLTTPPDDSTSNLSFEEWAVMQGGKTKTVDAKISSSSNSKFPSPSSVDLSLYTSERPSICSVYDPEFTKIDKLAYLMISVDSNSLLPRSFSAYPGTASIHLPSLWFSDVQGEVIRYARTPGSVDTKVSGLIRKQSGYVVVVDKNGDLWKFDEEDESLAIHYTDPSVAWKSRAHVRASLEDAERIEKIQFSLTTGSLSTNISCVLDRNELLVNATVRNNTAFDIENIHELTIHHWPAVPSNELEYEQARSDSYNEPRAKSSRVYAAASSSVQEIAPVSTLVSAPYEKTVVSNKNNSIPSLLSNSIVQLPLEVLRAEEIEWLAYFSDVKTNQYPSQKALLTLKKTSQELPPDMPCTIAATGQSAIIRFSQVVGTNENPQTLLDVQDGEPAAYVTNFEEMVSARTKGLCTCKVTFKVRKVNVSELQSIVISIRGFNKLEPIGKQPIIAATRNSSALFATPSESQTLLFVSPPNDSLSKWPSTFTVSYTKTIN